MFGLLTLIGLGGAASDAIGTAAFKGIERSNAKAAGCWKFKYDGQDYLTETGERIYIMNTGDKGPAWVGKDGRFLRYTEQNWYIRDMNELIRDNRSTFPAYPKIKWNYVGYGTKGNGVNIQGMRFYDKETKEPFVIRKYKDAYWYMDMNGMFRRLTDYSKERTKWTEEEVNKIIDEVNKRPFTYKDDYYMNDYRREDSKWYR